MSAPAQDPQWDSNGTNITDPPAAYKTDGWGGPRKKGVSAYMNWWKNLVYLWILWIKGNILALKRWEWYGLAGGPVYTGATLTVAKGVADFAAAGDKVEWIRIPAPVGAIITKIGIECVNLTPSGLGSLTVDLIRTNAGGNVVVIDTFNVNVIILAKSTHTLASPYTIAENGIGNEVYALYFRITNDGFGDHHIATAVGVEINQTGLAS